MKKLALSILISFAALFTSSAQTTDTGGQSEVTPYYFNIDTDVSGGSYSFTNRNLWPWKVLSLSYTLPAGTTNAFSFTVSRVTEENQYQGWVVSTNVFGDVESNYFATVTNTLTTTNTFTMYTNLTTTATSVAAQEGDDWVRDFYVLGGDIVTLSWSATNATIYATLSTSR